eukprot:PhM_4_TR7072/c0_g1_i1/m.2953
MSMMSDASYDDDPATMQLAMQLESITGQLRRDVIGAVTAIKSSAHNISQQHIEEERLRAAEHAAALQQNVTALQAVVSQKNKSLERVEDLLDGILNMYGRTRARFDRKHTLRQTWHAWWDQIRRTRHIRSRVEYIHRVHDMTTKRRVFFSWRSTITQDRDARYLKEAEEQLRTSAETAAVEARADLVHCQTELSAAKQRLAAEEENRFVLEEKLKAAFMKSVVALNHEALSVLRGGDAFATKPQQQQHDQDKDQTHPPHMTSTSSTSVAPAHSMIEDVSVPTAPHGSGAGHHQPKMLQSAPRVTLNPNHPLVRLRQSQMQK